MRYRSMSCGKNICDKACVGTFFTRLQRDCKVVEGGFVTYPGTEYMKTEQSAPLQEIVEARGHLIDSHVMETIFDTVVEFGGRFDVEEFRIGRTNTDQSYLRLRVSTEDRESMDKMLPQLLGLGCAMVEEGDAELRAVERDRCAPEDFYSTTNHRTEVRLGNRWVEVSEQRMDALIAVKDGKPRCRRLRDICAGDRVVTGMRGIRVIPEAKERDRLSFAFMSNGISSERQVETAVRQTAALLEQVRSAGQRVIVVAGPVVVHTGGAAPLSALIRGGYVDALLCGNALGVHDIEAALLGTSLGVPQSDGRQAEERHPVRVRAGECSLCAGGEPARRWSAARHHHRYE